MSDFKQAVIILFLVVVVMALVISCTAPMMLRK